MTTTPAILEALLETRSINWDRHPLVTASAELPTGPIGWAVSLVLANARRQRSALAFWAHPLTGKSVCIEMIENIMRQKFPGCYVAVLEAKSNLILGEGTFLTDILRSIGYEPKIAVNLANKREQVCRALYALGAGAQHVFLMIDEAQELAEKEIRWLKELINWLSRRKYKVTVVLFGQAELVDLHNELVASGRSDLNARFTKNLREFESIRDPSDIRPLLSYCDSASEYPGGSGWTYTQFLWPRAFAAGFRLANEEGAIWAAFRDELGVLRGSDGIAMHYVALTLAEFADITKDKDSAMFAPTVDTWRRAVALSDFANRQPSVREKSSPPLRKKRGRSP